MSGVRLDHVQIAIPLDGEAAARRFYGEVLGLREVCKPLVLRDRGGLWFELAGDIGLHLGTDPEFRPAWKAHPGLAFQAFDACLERLRQDGQYPAVSRDPAGRQRVYLEDPFGNRLEMIDCG